VNRFTNGRPKIKLLEVGAGACAQFPLTGNANDFEVIYKTQRIVKINVLSGNVYFHISLN